MKSVQHARKVTFLILGWFCVGLAIIGAILPLMPSFVFVLLASYCFSRSSDKYLHWLRTNKYFGETLVNYEKGRGLKPAIKCRAIAFIWGSIGVSIYFVQSNVYLVALLALIAITLTIYLIRLPSCSD
ncbi:YbaN family protein [Catenovulum sp. SM1970]|uniref:YbaN family protein n=1 Tax=Marinifaba aquimaris TaxID=2741323 RepID=UPI001572EB0C|nr:YbaN family protein [Marinifaba aquimaris]NTS78896.1 YbaN family protein [Marinifaba aquimaris]